MWMHFIYLNLIWKCVSTRKQNKLNKYIETQKEKFTQLDLQDVEAREKIKHCKSKNKKLQKQLEKDKEKVCRPFSCQSLTWLSGTDDQDFTETPLWLVGIAHFPWSV